MLVVVFIRKIKSLFCFVLHSLSRCFCCLRRKYIGDESLPVTVNINNCNEVICDNSFEKWDSWDCPSSVVSDGRCSKTDVEKSSISEVEKQIYEYRLAQQKKMQTSIEDVEEPNYFEDLAPKITRKPQIIILNRSDEEQQVSNRISMSLADCELQGSELQEWNEDGVGGWEGEAEEINVDEALREERERLRLERRLERLKKKTEKDLFKQNYKLAMKLS